MIESLFLAFLPLVHYRITSLPPNPFRPLHHQPDHRRDQLPQQVRPLLHLAAVDAAVPGGAAVDDLVAQRVEAVEHDAEHLERVLLAQRVVGRGPAPLEARLPVLRARPAIVEIPERLVHVAVVDQHPHRGREFPPQQLVEPLLLVALDQPTEEGPEQALLGEVLPVVDLIGIGRVEGDPQEHEASIIVLRLLLGALEPAQGAVDAQGEGLGPGVAFLAMALFEAGMIQMPKIRLTQLINTIIVAHAVHQAPDRIAVAAVVGDQFHGQLLVLRGPVFPVL